MAFDSSANRSLHIQKELSRRMLVFSDADDMYGKRFFNDRLFTDP